MKNSLWILATDHFAKSAFCIRKNAKANPTSEYGIVGPHTQWQFIPVNDDHIPDQWNYTYYIKSYLSCQLEDIFLKYEAELDLTASPSKISSLEGPDCQLLSRVTSAIVTHSGPSSLEDIRHKLAKMFFSDELSNDRRAALEDHRFSFNCGRPVRTTGHVVSAKDKTIAVLVERTIRHKKYGKVIKKRRKYQVHDESNISRIGDLVDFVECRPISKTKSHKLLYIISR